MEIGIVRTDFFGRTEATFESLVNPGRDVGPTHIHGITAEMVRDAPSLGDLAGSILDLLDGTRWVAHNAPFDVNFLREEFDREQADGILIRGPQDTQRIVIESRCPSFPPDRVS